MALFQAICEDVRRCLQSKKEQDQQQHRRSPHRNDVGPSSVAQFVMLLQLLLHLINRLDRSLNPNDPSLPQRWLSAGGYITPVTPNLTSNNSVDFTQPEVTIGGSSAPSGLLYLVQEVMGSIPKGHEKLRRVIQKLQTEMEDSELY